MAVEGGTGAANAAPRASAGSGLYELRIPVEERARLEYELAHERWTNGTSQRRTGLAFFTAVQGSLLTIIGDRLTNMDVSARALAVFGLIVTAIAWNHERRIGAYMSGYQKRALQIEEANDMALIRSGKLAAKERWTLSNRKMFSFYFILIAVGWLIVLGFDVLERLSKLGVLRSQ